ncbi:MAG TPA: phosphate ABC transporter permease subunit PstC [Acidimicrobiia bacterium]|jgi:phosphate transport system permease protein|nr:phosphate ABC transporter permease subunit PstC [Acidimicrobiia bacterium]
MATETLDPPKPQSLSAGPVPPGRGPDRVFRVLTLAAGLLVLVILLLIIVTTSGQAQSWFSAEGLGTIFSSNWDPAHHHFGSLGLLVGTIEVSLIALLISVPVSVGLALFVTEVSPRRLRRPIVYTVDLLAAVPSVVFGLWALQILLKPLSDAYSSVADGTVGFPLLGALFSHPSASGQAIMTAGIVVGIMITPIVTAITREVFATCPASQKEAALALGATRWEMIRGAVFPHGRSGVLSAVMIGFGRAVGETIAVALVVGSSPQLTAHIFGPGDTMASIIANEFGDATGTWRSALIGLGLALLALTVVIGIVARTVFGRSERRLGVVL